MNKKGQIVVYGLMLGMVVIILAMALAPAGNEMISSAMNVTTADAFGLDCTNSSISNFDKGACVVTDFSLFYFFGGLIFIGGAVIVGRIILT